MFFHHKNTVGPHSNYFQINIQQIISRVSYNLINLKIQIYL